MQDISLKLYIKMQSLKNTLVKDQSGQDLIEYALVVALIALAATAGMSALAVKISAAFGSVGTKLTTLVT